MVILKKTGRNIALLRNAYGINQEEAAFRSNLSVSRYQDIEHGCSNATADSLRRIAKTFEVDPRLLGIITIPDRELRVQMRSGIWSKLEQPAGGLSIYKNVVPLRQELGWTQAQLAFKSKVSVARLRDIEHGCANTTIHTLKCLAKCFGVTLLGLTFVTMPEEELREKVRQTRMMAGIRAA